MCPAPAVPRAALPCGLRADQTRLALFFFLRLGRRIRAGGSAGISGTRTGARPGVPFHPGDGTRRRAGRTWERRNTTRNPMLLLRLSG